MKQLSWLVIKYSPETCLWNGIRPRKYRAILSSIYDMPSIRKAVFRCLKRFDAPVSPQSSCN